MSDTTVLLPIKREASDQEERWLKQALKSLPNGTPYLILRNDGEVVDALNAGLKEAKTPYVIAMGADDLLGPDCIKFMEGPAWNADVVYPAMPIADVDLNIIGYHPAEPFCPYRLQQMNYVSGASLYRREKALQVGGYRDIGGMEDWDLWVRMWRAGGRFKPCPEAKYVYRFHENSRNSKVREDAEFRLKIRSEIVGKPDPLEEVKATFYNQATPGVTYLRAQLPARHLPAMVREDLMALTSPEEIIFPDHLGDAAVFVYPGDKTRAAALAVFKAQGIRTLVEVDDNYLINPGKQILKNSGWGLKIGESAHTRQGHRWIAENADGVIVTTRKLADAYRKVNPNVYICPNTVDPDDWFPPDKPDDGIFRIGWIASLSHKPDIPLVTRAFEWASRQKDVEVFVTSANPLTGAEGLNTGWKFNHGLIPWVDDLDAYRATFRFFDVIVAPIRELPFAIFRSDVKMLEASMGEALGICSDLPPYEDWHDKPCLMAKSAKDFYNHVKWCVANKDEVRRLAKEARAYVLKERTTAAQIGLWREALSG